MEFRKRGSWIRSLIFFLVDNGIEFLTIVSIGCAIAFLNVIGLLLVIPIVLIAWLLFNIIEIRESLLQIEENTTGLNLTKSTVNVVKEKKKEATKTPPKLADDEQYCPKCNKIIKNTAKKCRFCGEWLEDSNGGQQ